MLLLILIMDRQELIRNYKMVEKKQDVKYILNKDDVELILKQVHTNIEQVEELLIKYNGDIVKVIIHIFEENN